MSPVESAPSAPSAAFAGAPVGAHERISSVDILRGVSSSTYAPIRPRRCAATCVYTRALRLRRGPRTRVASESRARTLSRIVGPRERQ